MGCGGSRVHPVAQKRRPPLSGSELAALRDAEGALSERAASLLRQAAFERGVAPDARAGTEGAWALLLGVFPMGSTRAQREERLRELSEQGAKITEGLRDFKLEVAKAAVNSRTGRPIPLKQIMAFLEEDEEKIREIAKVRIKGVNLRHAARKLEQKLHGREQLAEGLHLIDFEQLKIENQTLSEKIEERNEELQKLRRKTRNTVQELTHVKEKMQFVEIQVAVLQAKKEGIETKLNGERDSLTTLKHERDALRDETGSAQQADGFVDSPALIADYEQRQTHIAAMREKLEELKATQARLRAATMRIG